MQDKNEKALTALAREAGNKSCFSCVGPGSLVRASSEGSFETEIPDARVFSRTTSRARAITAHARTLVGHRVDHARIRALLSRLSLAGRRFSRRMHWIRLTDEPSNAGAALRVRTFRDFRVHEMFGDIQRFQL